jgi:hypothetical protein
MDVPPPWSPALPPLASFLLHTRLSLAEISRKQRYLVVVFSLSQYFVTFAFGIFLGGCAATHAFGSSTASTSASGDLCRHQELVASISLEEEDSGVE